MIASPPCGRRSRFFGLAGTALVAAGAALAARAVEPPAPSPFTAKATAPGTAARLASADPRAPRRRFVRDPLPLASQDRLLATLRELSAIGGGALFRTSASRGEAAAFELVAQRLGALPFLAAAGIEIERQPFRTYLGGEVWEARLFVQRAGGGEIEVPAHALQPHRDDLARALRLDSDGSLNDTDRDPVEVGGAALPVRTLSQLNALTPAAVQGRVVLLDYALVDRSIMTSTEAITRASQLLAKAPAGIVLVTERSHVPGASHGSFVGDLGAFTLATSGTPRPTLYVRLEDLGGAGAATWADLAAVASARLRWDVDVLSPGQSQNLIARIPGADSSRAVILGAHLDSPNSPGALDDGSGVVSLLEVARALDEARARPPVDLYLCFFGSHERGLFGSSVFLQSHSELLDRAIAMLQTDCLRRPLDGLPSWLTLETRSFAMLADMARVALTGALAAAAEVPELRVTPPPNRRAVLVASHTESPHMASSLIDFGMAMAWEGYDLDVVPYGTPVTAADVLGAALVVALPVHDWPSPEGDATTYLEAWAAPEVDALQEYVGGGGLLVLTNSRYRMKYANYLYETNEDWAESNALAQRFGVTWVGGWYNGSSALTTGSSPLIAGVTRLTLATNNGVPFTHTGGTDLARIGFTPAATLLRPGGGAGEVLALGDLGILGAGADGPVNLRFWQNLARYARAR